jgi:hypothetical protein
MKSKLLASSLLLAMAAFAAPATAAIEQPPVPSVLALTTTGSEAELLIYGPIGDIFWDGITAAGIVWELQQLNVNTIRVRINSRGRSTTRSSATRRRSSL